MIRLRVGTRGSELALWQTRWVCKRLRDIHPTIDIDEVIIKTHGDTDQRIASQDHLRPPDGWPVGAFVGALENALLDGRVDLAVHSYKDLQTTDTKGLTISAVPAREVVNDVLLTSNRVELNKLPNGLRIGTGSPRRAAQLRHFCKAVIVPIRGNVRTRIDKISKEGLDGVVLAAAGLARLSIVYPNTIVLPTDRFVPAPAQGALAIQACENSEAASITVALDDPDTRRAVQAERSFLAQIGAGCQTPVGALAVVEDGAVRLRGQLWDDAGKRMVEGVEVGSDPVDVGVRLAERLRPPP